MIARSAASRLDGDSARAGVAANASATATARKNTLLIPASVLMHPAPSLSGDGRAKSSHRDRSRRGTDFRMGDVLGDEGQHHADGNHWMRLSSSPASILNQNPPDLGIPNRLSLTRSCSNSILTGAVVLTVGSAAHVRSDSEVRPAVSQVRSSPRN